MTEKKDICYPNCASSVFLRSCEEEITTPLEGKTTGHIPPWLQGTLLRNGPGTLKVGSMSFDHVFDGSALLHSFKISEGTATYQCRFVRTDTYKRNKAANRIVVTEFATESVPDPCHTIFDRFTAFFKPLEKLSDNTVVSVYPIGDEIYTFTESPIIHRIDPKTLKTLERKDLIKDFAIVNHSAHPHILPNGDVINIGLSYTSRGMRHVVIHFPFTEKGDMFERAHIVGGMKPRWQMHPSYMHSFGITENYFVLIEQPMTISLRTVLWNVFLDKPFASALQWYPKLETNIVLISRKTGEEVRRYRTETLFYFHVINAFEDGQNVVLDFCTYKDAKILNGMYIKAMESIQSNEDCAEWFRARAKRLKMPLESPDMTFVEAKLLANIGCETPRIHYNMYNGKSYRYFYAISSDIDNINPGAVVKVDTWSGDYKTWFEAGSFASEPVFVPEPQAQEEDAGILLCVLLYGSHICKISLLLLDSRTLLEVGRVTFDTPSPSPKCIHGWFISDRV
ncbi:PREDICTED: carotenoid isomerooxygenase-like [Papilio xuthus]|uniref:Carotenoid isomerooxygenase-like n=1 Tax=Papilio xuthus TaxID=66420 RepID=A0AAJ6ZXY3_PAPXU|nr:PREDICTED: carotenoid isomerooxygenase-like [Papilio xuthus]